jgi:hypothetical protein
MTAPRIFNSVSRFKGWDMSRKAAQGRYALVHLAHFGRSDAQSSSLARRGGLRRLATCTIKRPHGKSDAKGRRNTIEINLPILPTFLFARASGFATLAHMAGAPAHQHPPFSLFSHAGRIPLIGDASVSGLREEEERLAAELIEALRNAETRRERRRIRSAELRTKRKREKALRAERRDFAVRVANYDD